MPYLAQNGWFITNTTPFVNIPNYPDTEKLMNEVNAIPNHVAINADQIAKDMGVNRSMNMVMLGAASIFLDIPYEKLEEGIKFVFGRKGEEVVEANLKAMKAGKDFADENKT
jgi:indolepyruvate ferredoxin oxidoreductase beta subunit